MHEYEKLGVFYLGRRYDLDAGESTSEPVLYDSKDLTTHAVCVGMTGSGKTGLGVGIIEEAALDGLPVLAIDPKGDLSNLLLTFPELSAEAFAPWVSEDAAKKKGLTREAFAEAQATLWREGLARWGQDADRIRRLRNAAEFTVFTPGSSAGVPVSIVDSFRAPAESVRTDPELLGDRVSTAVSSLLGFVGIDADPLQSRDHILLSNLLHRAWQQGEDLDLPGLIQAIQSPSIDKVGVLDLDSFYPESDRFKLAMRVNNLLAAPGFGTWMEGHPLDVQQLLYTPEGKPRVSIVSIAHLDDSQRMFFVSLLLNEVLGWARAQSGTSSLRAVLYMDEIFGYLPPVANPPSKTPMLTLLKQARAYGLGLVLATQNPVDLDYKALSNAGTWLIGRLQTERDKKRVLEGLEGAAAGASRRFDRQAMEETLAGLKSRVFLLNNVHEDEPVVFETRWVMSYLSGPMTRDQIRDLMGDRKEALAAAAAPAPPSPTGPTAAPEVAEEEGAERPVLPPAIDERFLRSGGPHPYEPHVYAAADLHFLSRKYDIETSQRFRLLAPVPERAGSLDWNDATPTAAEPDVLTDEPEDQARFAALPSSGAKARSYKGWSKELSEWLYRQKLTLWRSEAFDAISEPGENEADFRVRLRQRAREVRDAEVDELRARYATKLRQAEDRVGKAEQRLTREQSQAKQRKLDAVMSAGYTVLGALLGRKKLSVTNLGRAKSTSGAYGRSRKEAQDVDLAEESLEKLRNDLSALQSELEEKVQELERGLNPDTEVFVEETLRPRRTDVQVEVVALAWKKPSHP